MILNLKKKARAAVGAAVGTGRLSSAKKFHCVDCGKRAQEYDHFKGYEKKNWLKVQPTCSSCNKKRSYRRGEIVNVKNIGFTGHRHSSKTKTKISEMTKDQWSSTTARKKKIDGVKRMWANPQIRKKHLAGVLKNWELRRRIE